MSFPLVAIEYDLLLQGEKLPALDNARWAAVGILFAVIITIAGTLSTVSYDEIAKHGPHALGMFIGLIALGALAFFMIALITATMRWLVNKDDSAYARLRHRIDAKFGRKPPPPGLIRSFVHRLW